MSTPSRADLKHLAELHHRKGRRKQGLFLVEGRRSVEAALHAGAPITEVFLSHEQEDNSSLREWAARAGATVSFLSRKDLERVSAVDHGQGMLAVSKSVTTDAPAGLADARTVLVLDGVQDPGNVGALIRTAAWFGVEAVLAGSGTADFGNPKVVRSSMGGIWDVRLVQSSDLSASLRALAENGLPITGADPAGDPAAGWSPSCEGVLVLGSEAHGISEGAQTLLDRRVALFSGLPPAGRGVESLNVVVAGGILLHQWLGGGR